MQIGELAKRAGVKSSAIRYYESIGLLPPQKRVGGQRMFGEDALERLTVIVFAKQAGFTLREIRELFSGFAVKRWKPLAQRKIVELDETVARIERMRSFLTKAIRCGCVDVEECGRALMRKCN
jgi:MerR family redox-sensitive transcriptional activator SoxR